MECSIPLALRQEVSRCLLCYDAPCSKACPAKNKPDRFLRALYFQNLLGAARITVTENPLAAKCAMSCKGNAYCQKACIRRKIDRPIDIPSIQTYLAQIAEREELLSELEAKKFSFQISIIGSSISAAVTAIFLSKAGCDVSVYCPDAMSWLLQEEGKTILQQYNIAIKQVTSIQDECIWNHEADVFVLTNPIEMGSNNKKVYIACELNSENKLDVVSVRQGRMVAQKILKYTQEREEENHEDYRYVH